MDAAANAYARAVELDPTTMDAWRARVDMRKFEPGDPDIARLETVFKSGRLTPAQRMTACFALGKIYEDVGQYNRAFWCFQEGNRLKRNTISFNINNVIQQHNEIRRTFDASLLERQRDLGEPDATPIFILGMPRSGTTLAEQILASHPDVFGAGELYDLSKICGETAREHGLQGPYPRWVPDLTPEAMRALGRRYVDRIRAGRPDRAHITDKMPSNYRFVGLIRLLLPNAKIIHMRRHPADTCLSCYTKLFAESQNHTYDLTELGRSYRAYEELMAHWRAVLPPDGMLEVQYERLVADPRTQIQRLLDFCGLPWADACLQFHRTKRGVSTASVSQVRRPLYTSSVQRWRRFADHLNPLFDALAAGYKESGPE
jgi:tetratricopeptide (TPR) repeat protein